MNCLISFTKQFNSSHNHWWCY